MRASSQISIAALSHKYVSSIAVLFNLSLTCAAQKIVTFLKEHEYFDHITNNYFAHHMLLLNGSEEVLYQYRDGKRLILAEMCPGWATYDETAQEVYVIGFNSNDHESTDKKGVREDRSCTNRTKRDWKSCGLR